MGHLGMRLRVAWPAVPSKAFVALVILRAAVASTAQAHRVVRLVKVR